MTNRLFSKGLNQIPKKIRKINWLKRAVIYPISVNVKWCAKYDKDLRELVKEGYLSLHRGKVSSSKKITILEITDKGKELLTK